jgi:acetolactate decarboxylase
VSFAELSDRGDLGLGTVNHLDDEMIAVDGLFYRADVEGRIEELPGSERTPFAVVVPFAPEVNFERVGSLDHESLLAAIEERVPPGTATCAVRIDGGFELIRARSVPRQEPPYRPLIEVVEEQRVFELADLDGTMLGFRFPDDVEGIEVSGWHLHFISEDRSRGGHVLGSRSPTLQIRLDPSGELQVELPPGIDLTADEHARASEVRGLRHRRAGDKSPHDLLQSPC